MNKIKLLAVVGIVSLIGTRMVAYADEGVSSVPLEDTYKVQSGGMICPIDAVEVLKNDGILVDYNIPQPKKEEDKVHTSESSYTKWNKKGKASGVMTFECTAYCNCIKCCGKYSPEAGGKGTTFSGTYPKEGRTIAVDPNVIPIGTKVVINGNVYTAEDTGSASKGNRIDIFFESQERGNAFGRRRLKVRILK